MTGASGARRNCPVMGDRVVPLWPPERPPRLDELVTEIRSLAAEGGDTTRIHFGHPHFRERLAQRKVSMRQVLETLRKGVPSKGDPRRDRYGDWRVKLQYRTSDRRVQVVVVVVVVVKQDHIVAVTVI